LGGSEGWGRKGRRGGKGEGEIGVIGEGDEEAKGPLPRGWEVKSCRGKGGKMYFVGHNERKATWEIPTVVRE
jgi:hypothetical protein